MQLVQKLKQFEKQFVYLKWATDEGYGKINYVGCDFIEFEMLDVESMEYNETVLINAQLLLEIVLKSSDVSRVIAEYSSTLPHESNDPLQG